jgi:tetratricopeptide (TPR) repeat protein
MRPRRSGLLKMVLLLAAVLAGFAGGVIYIVIGAKEPPQSSAIYGTLATKPVGGTPATSPAISKQPLRPQAATTRHATTMPAETAVVSAQTAGEIQHAVNDLMSAIGKKDYRAADAMIDMPRHLEEMRGLNVLAGFSADEYARLLERWENHSGEELCKDPRLHFHQVEIRRIEALADPDEVRVYVHAFGKQETMARLWFRKTESVWRLYDYQRLDSPDLRESRVDASAVARNTVNPPAWCMEHFFARLTTDDLAAEFQAIELLQEARFPAEYESFLLTLKGMNILRRGRAPAEALRLFDEALAWYPDSPVVYRCRAMAFARAKRHESTIGSITKYLAIVGDSSMDCAYLGLAYMWLDKRAEAAKAYQRGLACDPSSEPNRIGLEDAMK